MTNKAALRFVAPLFCLAPFWVAGQSVSIRLKNTLPIERNDELIVLKRDLLLQKAKSALPGSFYFADEQNTPLPFQLDDLDADGKWDEAALLISFKPGQLVVINLLKGKTPSTTITTKAHVRHRKKLINDKFGPLLNNDSVPAGQPNTDFGRQKLPDLLTEGPAWENDKVGFRLYMDIRNTKDIWGKTTAKMMMDTVGANPALSYHDKSDWGMDILAVGKSLGAGSLSLLMPYNGKDTLMRLGGAAMGPIYYEKVADGPIRAIFRMHYPHWQAIKGQQALSLTEEIAIWGGQYYYSSKVTVNNAPKNAALIVGLVNLKNLPMQHISNKGSSVLYTYGKQSENNDALGMAVVLSAQFKPTYGEVTKQMSNDVANTYYTAIPLTAKPIVFNFIAAWQQTNALFDTEAGFKKYLGQQLLHLNHAIVIK